MSDYQTRYQEARELLQRLPTEPAAYGFTTADVDQFQAATRDTLTMTRGYYSAVKNIDPQRNYEIRESRDSSGRDDVMARVMAAMGDGGWTICTHLSAMPAQPSIARLPLRRIDCTRCAQTIRRPPAGEDDRCDLCGARNVTTFWPLATPVGNMFVLGDMCHDCAVMVYAHAGATPQ